MFFNKKSKNTVKCDNCSSKIDKNFSFCPHCGNPLFDESEEEEEFGLLGKSDSIDDNDAAANPFANFGITDNLINSVMGSIMKNLTKELNKAENQNNTEIHTMPNGIKIRIGTHSSPVMKKPSPKKQAPQKEPTEEQLEKMSRLPRASAKTSIKRFSDRMIYEFNASGVKSVDDIFISKLESGYEIKAIGEKKVYVNTLPISLPLKKFMIEKDKILFEFKTDE